MKTSIQEKIPSKCESEEKERAPTLVFLPQKSHGQRNLAGCSPTAGHFWGEETVPGKLKWSEVKSLSRVWLFATPWTVAHQALLSPWDFPGMNTRVGFRFLLQGIFPTQGSNPGLLHCRQIPYHLSHQGNPWKVFLRGNKIIQVENSNLHKERENITEEIGKGKIKLSFLFFLIDLIDNNLFKVTISTDIFDYV